jgi:TatD DNase family protein
VTAEPPQVRVLVGCHPHNAARYTPEVERTLKVLAARPVTSGIGEIGLDYHYDYSPRAAQREVFVRQLALAAELMLPVALHLREAHADGLAILREMVPLPGGIVLHCYNLDYATLEPFLMLGCHVAFGGPLTFKKSDEVRDAAARVPLGRLVTETDAPFMTPEPLRGTVCGPEHTVFTAALLAELKLTKKTAGAGATGASREGVACRAAAREDTSHEASVREGASRETRHQAVTGRDTNREAIAILNTLYENARRLFDRERE